MWIFVANLKNVNISFLFFYFILKEKKNLVQPWNTHTDWLNPDTQYFIPTVTKELPLFSLDTEDGGSRHEIVSVHASPEQMEPERSLSN